VNGDSEDRGFQRLSCPARTLIRHTGCTINNYKLIALQRLICPKEKMMRDRDDVIGASDRDESVSNQLEGKWKQMKGSVKQAVGDLTNDTTGQMSGAKDRMEGKIQEQYGRVKGAEADLKDDYARIKGK
jgi:uncharacterized protein YjbJ (UPF0337 family)